MNPPAWTGGRGWLARGGGVEGLRGNTFSELDYSTSSWQVPNVTVWKFGIKSFASARLFSFFFLFSTEVVPGPVQSQCLIMNHFFVFNLSSSGSGS